MAQTNLGGTLPASAGGMRARRPGEPGVPTCERVWGVSSQEQRRVLRDVLHDPLVGGCHRIPGFAHGERGAEHGSIEHRDGVVHIRLD
jgi:hypothetical protein